MTVNQTKIGSGNKLERANANGIPDNPLTAPAGLSTLKLRDLFALVWDAGFSACYSWMNRRRVTSEFSEVPAPPNPMKAGGFGTDYDDIAVSNFAMQMQSKLARKREQFPDRDWTTTDPEKLSAMLREHVEKGDPVDVANFCMFLQQRGFGISK